MDSAKQQLVEKLKTSNNVLVTVSRNPSVDQLAALLGLSLLLNKQGKHCAAVFSGQIPSTIEFLKPEDTIEKTTDSLRDFIIALDKSKADKLRYKVEDNIVRIFITPYRTSISQDDLEFSQGDFNVDLVIALGVQQQSDLDETITAHGRILHDAVVASINIAADSGSGLGTINWNEAGASSLSESVAELAQATGNNSLDEQIATALLTGIVSETERFSNDKTSSQTMSISAALMAAGANQQLIATKLEESGSLSGEQSNGFKIDEDHSGNGPSQDSNGTLDINHGDEAKAKPPNVEDEKNDKTNSMEELPPPSNDGETTLTQIPEPGLTSEPSIQQTSGLSPGPKLITEPPSLGGTLTANSSQNDFEPTTDPFSLPQSEPPQLLQRQPNPLPPTDSTPPSAPPIDSSTAPQLPAEPPLSGLTPPPPSWIPPPPPQTDQDGPPQVHIDDDGTLSQLEEAVHSPHVTPQTDTLDTTEAREEVNKAIDALPIADSQPPIEALNAQLLGPELHSPDPANPLPIPQVNDAPSLLSDQPDPQSSGLPEPPPVPPPIPFEFGKPPT